VKTQRPLALRAVHPDGVLALTAVPDVLPPVTIMTSRFPAAYRGGGVTVIDVADPLMGVVAML
jgi:hypothetical protein